MVGTTPGGGNVFNGWVGNVLTKTVAGTNGQTLYARVCARDRAGNLSNWSGVSDGIAVDTRRPRLTPLAVIDYCTVLATFDEPVVNANQPSNYSCTRGVRIIGISPLSGGARYRVMTTKQVPGTSYTLTVRNLVKDRAGDSLDPALSSSSFKGGKLTGANAWSLYR